MSILRSKIMHRSYKEGPLGNGVLKGDQGSVMGNREKEPSEKK